MKKITLLFLLVIASVFNAHAQFPEGFETTVPPTGWASFRGVNGLGTTYDWVASTTIFASGAQSAFVRYENVTGGLAEDWLVTPQFTPSASANVLSYLQRQAFTADYGTVYTIRVSTASQNTHADFTIVDTQTEADLGLAFAVDYVDLSAYNGVPIYVAFVMTQDDGDNWYIDDVDLISSSTAPDCASNPTPADMATNVANPFGFVTFSWDAPTTGDSPTGYEFFFGETSGALTSLGTTTETTVVLNGVDFSTTYYWMVVPFNAGGSSTGCAEWSFTTEVAPPPPANDNIAGAIPLTLDAGFCDGVLNNGSNFLATDSGEGVGTCFNGDNADNDVWFSITIPNGVATIDISTDFTGGTLVDSEIALYSGTTGSLVEIDCDQDDGITVLSNGSSWNSLIVNASVTEGETYLIQVAGYEATDMGSFCIEVNTNTLGIGSEELIGFTYYPNPVKNTLNLNAQSNIQNVSIYNMLGQEVLRAAPNSLNSEINMASIQTGAYFVQVTIDDAVKTIKIVRQ